MTDIEMSNLVEEISVTDDKALSVEKVLWIKERNANRLTYIGIALAILLCTIFFDQLFLDDGGAAHPVAWLAGLGISHVLLELFTRAYYGKEYSDISYRIHQMKEKENEDADKEWKIPTHKKMFFGLWKRELTGMEQLYHISPELVYDHYSNESNSKNQSENQKLGMIDLVHTITNIRCTHCDGPTEGGPHRGTYLCASCGFLFDSKGNTL